jgi:diguanylate cyclase (GGDEF)-like protein/PAS domain S-box-containing protein
MDFRRSEIFGSIKLRITLAAIAALLLGVGLSTVLLVRQAERDTLAGQRDRELSAAVGAAAQLSAEVVERQRALRISSTQFDRAMLAEQPRLQHLLENKPLLRGLFASVFIAGADGRVRAVGDGQGVRVAVVDVSDRDYFRRAVRERRAVISEPLASRVGSETVIVFAQPLEDAAGVFGMLGGVLRLSGDSLLGLGTENGDEAGAGVSIVADARGRMLTHPTDRALLQPLATDPRLAEAHAQWLASGSPVEPSGLMLRQSGELVSVAGVAGTEWVVWRAMPEQVLLEPLHAARRQALVWAVALVAVLALAMLAVLTWLLRPLALLAERAQHLFDGSRPIHEGWPQASGEIERLSRVLRHVGAERAQLEAFNAEVLRKLGSVMAAAPVGICFTRNRCFELVSEEFCRLFGRPEADLLGQSASIIYASNEDYQTLGPLVLEAFRQGRAYEGEWQMLRADGTRFWGQLRGRPVAEDEPGAGTIWTVVDISGQVAAREQLEWSASHDALTGLANRKPFAQRMARVVDALPRSLPAAVVMIDLDHFKPINDRAGHAAGDAMLKAVAAAITSRVRATDLVVRLGGDEFALLLERCPHDTALRIAENVRQAIVSIALPWHGETLRVGASLGVASLTAETAGADAWLAEADAACYAAKAAGRGAVRDTSRPVLRVVN